MLSTIYHKGADVLNVVWEALQVLRTCIWEHVKVDKFLAIILAVFSILVFPLIPRLTDDAFQLHAYANDEPFITMQLDGMTVPPYGSPSNFLEFRNKDRIPAYWYNLRYYDIIYYGGTYLNIAFLFFAPLKFLGVGTFPSAPLVLRTISALAGLFGLVLVYNFGKKHAGNFAAAFTVAFLLLDSNFMEFSTRIHPDSLMWAFCFLSLIVAALHANRGDRASLVALGIVIGLVQGTKAGGIFLLPMALTATALGVGQSDQGHARAFWGKCIFVGFRVFILGTSALGALFVSSPSIFLHRYYFRTMRAAAGILTDSESPVSSTTCLTWLHDFGRHLGLTLTVAALAGIFLILGQWLRGRKNVPLVLAMLLVLGNVFYYAVLGRYWVCLFYLVPAFGLTALVAGSGLAWSMTWLRQFGTGGVWVAGGLGAVFFLLGISHSITLTSCVFFQRVEKSTKMMVGEWAAQNIPAGSKIMYDDQAYFDPTLYPDQLLNGGPLRYCNLFRDRPDYLVVTNYANAWPTEKRRTQDRLGKWDDWYYSFRLPQDLLGRMTSTHTLGPTAVPYLELVAVIEPSNGPAWQKESSGRWINENCPATIRDWHYVFQLFLNREQEYGNELFVFRVHPNFYLADPPSTPLCSASASVTDPKNAFDRRPSAWYTADSAAKELFIGADFGADARRATRTVRIQWAEPDAIPAAVRVDYSDDGKQWNASGAYDVEKTAAAASADSKFLLPPVGAHRYWRVVAIGIPEGHRFGLDELYFDVAFSSDSEVEGKQ